MRKANPFISFKLWSTSFIPKWIASKHVITFHSIEKLLVRSWRYFKSLYNFQGSLISGLALNSWTALWIFVVKFATWFWTQSVISLQVFIHSFFLCRWCSIIKCRPSTSYFSVSHSCFNSSICFVSVDSLWFAFMPASK